jgi:hypothetical protein
VPWCLCVCLSVRPYLTTLLALERSLMKLRETPRHQWSPLLILLHLNNVKVIVVHIRKLQAAQHFSCCWFKYILIACNFR